jgi:hypothetical protein
MNLLRLICLLSLCCLLGAAREVSSIPAPHPEQIGGRWETVTPSGIEGLGFEIFSQSNGAPGSGGEPFVLQQVNVLVYTREGGQEKGGYFSALYSAKPVPSPLPYPTSFDVFDGQHLRMHFAGYPDAKPFDLDIAFLPKANKWMGTWSRDGKDERVTLARPEANNGVERSKFVGEWMDQSAPNDANESTTINIRQSPDGVLSAWLDEPPSGVQRNGQQLNIESVSDSTIVLKTRVSTGVPDRFRGSLSADGQTLTGEWGTPDGCCGTPGGAEQFHKAAAARQ